MRRSDRKAQGSLLSTTLEPPVANSGGRALETTRREEAGAFLHDWAVVIALVLLVLGAGYVRATLIWPEATGLRESPYDDEGVYAAAAQLIAQGKHPFRDFIYAHPPLGPLLLLPAIEYHFTLWGSPTTFMMLRYLVVVYSALTVGLVFLLSWRLWGLVGGLLSGVLLLLDPSSVWVGRHVMLEGPLLFLLALAALLYVLARGQEQPSTALLIGAGFVAAAAGGVKLQGLVLLMAFLIDLITRRRGLHAFTVVVGAALLWLPLWIYLVWVRDGNPLGQFIWFQLLRPGDGTVSLAGRLASILDEATLVLIAAALALALLPAFRLRPASALRRRANQARRAARATGARLGEVKRLSGFSEPDEAETQPPVDAIGSEEPTVAATTGSLGSPTGEDRAAPARAHPAWSLLPWWVFLVTVMLFFSRSFYAHYVAQLALPLALLAGALPAAIAHLFRINWSARAFGIGVTILAVAVLLPFGYNAAAEDFRERHDRLYEITGRYAGDAAQPDDSVFALDAQIPFRAARRPAREHRDRFIVDGYGMLLYHGLGIDGRPVLELARRALRPIPPDPYAVMWHPVAQEQLRDSMARSDLIVIDKQSEARLTAATRAWLNRQARLEERQDRYAIYRITR